MGKGCQEELQSHRTTQNLSEHSHMKPDIAGPI